MYVCMYVCMYVATTFDTRNYAGVVRSNPARVYVYVHRVVAFEKTIRTYLDGLF
jgi:hypothetical protein